MRTGGKCRYGQKSMEHPIGVVERKGHFISQIHNVMFGKSKMADADIFSL